MKIQPLNDIVLVLREEKPKRTKGGLIIPDSNKEKPQMGKVVAVGTGKLNKNGNRIPPLVKVGDRILFSSYAGTEIKLDNVDHIFMKEDEILAILS